MNPSQFADQADAGTGVFGSPGLAETQQRANAEVPRSLGPLASENGMAASQYEQTLGGQMPVQNGIATGQYNTWKFTQRGDE